jgi:hypothetical protein
MDGDGARHVIGFRLMRETRVLNSLDHVASAIHESLARGISATLLTVATATGGTS